MHFASHKINYCFLLSLPGSTWEVPHGVRPRPCPQCWSPSSPWWTRSLTTMSRDTSMWVYPLLNDTDLPQWAWIQACEFTLCWMIQTYHNEPGYKHVSLPFVEWYRLTTMSRDTSMWVYPLLNDTDLPQWAWIQACEFTLCWMIQTYHNEPGYKHVSLPFVEWYRLTTMSRDTSMWVYPLLNDTDLPQWAGIQACEFTLCWMIQTYHNEPGYKHVSLPFVEWYRLTTMSLDTSMWVYPLLNDTDLPQWAWIQACEFTLCWMIQTYHNEPGYKHVSLPFVEWYRLTTMSRDTSMWVYPLLNDTDLPQWAWIQACEFTLCWMIQTYHNEPGYKHVSLPFVEWYRLTTMSLDTSMWVYPLLNDTDLPQWAWIQACEFTLCWMIQTYHNEPGYKHVSLPFVEWYRLTTMSLDTSMWVYPLLNDTDLPQWAWIQACEFTLCWMIQTYHNEPGYKHVSLPFVEWYRLTTMSRDTSMWVYPLLNDTDLPQWAGIQACEFTLCWMIQTYHNEPGYKHVSLPFVEWYRLTTMSLDTSMWVYPLLNDTDLPQWAGIQACEFTLCWMIQTYHNEPGYKHVSLPFVQWAWIQACEFTLCWMIQTYHNEPGYKHVSLPFVEWYRLTTMSRDTSMWVYPLLNDTDLPQWAGMWTRLQ